jgi:thiosulfate dehydrogenase (quinone) large subunit
MDKLSQLSDQLQARLRVMIVPFIRIVVGLLWLENAAWKVPNSFTGSFRKYTESAVDHEVFGPYAYFIKNIALKHFTAFGWLTMLTETLIGALLIFGIFTRFASLLGVMASLAITLSVLHYENEWPWSYYLMIAAHLALFALDAGRIGGIDAVLEGGRRSWKQAATLLGGLSVLLGALSFWRAGSKPFGARFGQYLLAKRAGTRSYEFALYVLNRRGALIFLLLGLVVLAAGAIGQQRVLLVASAGFALLTLSLYTGFRRTSTGTVGGFTGGNGSTLCLFLGFTLATFLLSGQRLRPSGTKTD